MRRWNDINRYIYNQIHPFSISLLSISFPIYISNFSFPATQIPIKKLENTIYLAAFLPQCPFFFSSPLHVHVLIFILILSSSHPYSIQKSLIPTSISISTYLQNSHHRTHPPIIKNSQFTTHNSEITNNSFPRSSTFSFLVSKTPLASL